MLKIRLMRIGTKKRPFYRVVAADERGKRTGKFIENLGTYNPLSDPKEIKLNQDRIDHWIKQGAQMSVGFLRIIGKAPQRKPRKPKKEAKQIPAAAPQASEAPAKNTPESEEPAAEAKEQSTEPTAENPAPAGQPVSEKAPEPQHPESADNADKNAVIDNSAGSPKTD